MKIGYGPPNALKWATRKTVGPPASLRDQIWFLRHCGDVAEVLEPAKHAFDNIAMAASFPVKGIGQFSVCLVGNYRLDAQLREPGTIGAEFRGYF